MPRPGFTYRPILQELTAEVNAQGLDPFEAYQWLQRRQVSDGLRPETYCSSSITSGGHARDESLQMQQVIERNTRSAALLAEQLATDGQLNPTTAIEPVFVGKTHWDQAEFMEFWLSVIGGYSFTPGFLARDVDNLRSKVYEAYSRAELDRNLMTSRAEAEVRAAEYFKMSSVFAGLITDGTEAQPMDSLIRMIDTQMSLGSQTERAFARQIGVKVMNICVVRPAGAKDLESVNRTLAVDAARLINFGATIFDLANNRVRLVLEQEAA